MLVYPFEVEKAVVSVKYVARFLIATQGKLAATCSTITKLLYLADKTSLENVGRFIFGETYIAEEDGPRPQNLSALLESAKLEKTFGIKVDIKYIDLKPKKRMSTDRLSISDIECLDQINLAFGRMPYWYLRQLCRDEAYLDTWKKGKGKGAEITIINMTKMLDDSHDLADHILHQGE